VYDRILFSLAEGLIDFGESSTSQFYFDSAVVSISDLGRINSALLIVYEAVSTITLYFDWGVALLLSLFLVDLTEFFCLFVGLPLFGVLCRVNLQLLALGHNFAHNCEERLEDEVDEARLALGDLRSLTVAQKRHREALLLLDVTLVEEFVEEEMGPCHGNFKGASLSRDVGRVHSKLYQLLLRVELFFVRLAVNKKLAPLSVRDSLLLHASLNLRQV